LKNEIILLYSLGLPPLKQPPDLLLYKGFNRYPETAMPHSNTQHQERLAVILNRAISDESFAAQLHMNPTNAGKDLDLTLRIDEVVALKGLDLAQLAAASKALRSPLAGRATFDQQQVRTD
jgi:hypothetical protein